jgi:hypothetical protein
VTLFPKPCFPGGVKKLAIKSKGHIIIDLMPSIVISPARNGGYFTIYGENRCKAM